MGLFTFVSVDFQLFKKFPDWYAAAGIVFISAAIMIGFVLLTHFLFSKSPASDSIPSYQQKNERFKLLIVALVTAAALGLGLVLLYLSAHEMGKISNFGTEPASTSNTFNPTTSIQFTNTSQATSSSQFVATSTRP